VSKNRGQSTSRALKRNNIDLKGRSLKRPFNNSKRTKGRQDQVNAEKYWRYMTSRLNEIKDTIELMQEEE